MFIDASVIVAILTGESDGEAYTICIEDDEEAPHVTSVLARWEATVGIFRKTKRTMREAHRIVEDFLDVVGIEVLPLRTDDDVLALQVFETHGRHAEQPVGNLALNMADCFHYAVAKRARIPILTKDAGFALTDLATVRIA